MFLDSRLMMIDLSHIECFNRLIIYCNYNKSERKIWKTAATELE